MLKSRTMVLGAVLAAMLTLAATAGAAVGLWWLVVASAMVLVSSTFLLTLDASRRIRYLPGRVRQVVRRAMPRKIHQEPEPAPVAAAPPTEQDVVGTVRVLQAQYLGRLDKLQADVESALAALHSWTASHTDPAAGRTGSTDGRE